MLTLTAPPVRRLLAVTGEMPWPLHSGGRLRTFHLLRLLARRHRVRLVVPCRTPPTTAARVALDESGIEVIPVAVPARTAWSEAVAVGVAALCREPYVCYRRHRSRRVAAAVRAQVAEWSPDLLYLDHLDSGQYADCAGDLPCLLDLHNVYSRMVARTGAEQPSAFTRHYLRHEAKLLARKERRLVSNIAGVLAVSHLEADYFRHLGARGVAVVPNGADSALLQPRTTANRSTEPVVLFLGSLNWPPNIDAASFLATQVLPCLQAWDANVRLDLVGRDPTPAVRELATRPGVRIVADVPDVRPYLHGSTVMAVPLAAGSGTRLKIYEAFAGGLPVVSTPVGCEGIEAEAGRHLVVASRAGFARALLHTLGSPSVRTTLRNEARALACEQFDWEQQEQPLLAAVERVCKVSRPLALSA